MNNEIINIGKMDAAVYYHGNCYDGFGAAWACWNKFNMNASYTSCVHGDENPVWSEAKDAYVVDFSFPIETLIEMCDIYETVYLIDHHKTALERFHDYTEPLPENLHITLDMEKSGALLTWEHLFPDTPAPKLIEYISDRDLWEFKMSATKLVHLALKSYPMDFQTWDNFNIENLVDRGASCERLHERLVMDICDNAWVEEVQGHEVPVVNTTIAWSEVGAELLKRFPESPFSVSFTTNIDNRKFSLRSRAEGDNFDVSKVAGLYGGGGHRNAAGFSQKVGVSL